MNLLPPQVEVWAEPLMGSAALALALEAGQSPAFTYQGGKSTLTGPSLAVLGLRPGGRARRYVLNDLGMMPWFYGVLRRSGDEVARRVEAVPGGRAGFDLVVAAGVPADEVERAAAYAVLQGSSVQGKPPAIVDGRWRTAGYAELSPAAVARGFTAKLNPPVLGRRLRDVARVLADMDVVFTTVCASEMPVPSGDGRRIGYFDPPYQGTTGYRSGLSREALFRTTARWVGDGFEVAIAEKEPLGRSVEIVRDDGRPLPKGRREFLTLVEPML